MLLTTNRVVGLAMSKSRGGKKGYRTRVTRDGDLGLVPTRRFKDATLKGAVALLEDADRRVRDILLTLDHFFLIDPNFLSSSQA